jgi:hypothetical protein
MAKYVKKYSDVIKEERAIIKEIETKKEEVKRLKKENEENAINKGYYKFNVEEEIKENGGVVQKPHKSTGNINRKATNGVVNLK